MKLWRYIVCWAFLVGVFSALLWGGVFLLKSEMLQEESLAQLQGYRAEIDEMVLHRWRGLEILAADSLVIGALSGRDVPEVERLFDVVAGMEAAAIVYLMNSEGDVVASSTYDGSLKLTGNNYRFRPYFKYAMMGRKVVFPAVGVTTLRRGIYMSCPVWDQGMDPVGVVVFKLAMERVDELFRHASSPIVILEASGVVFAGNTSRWLFHAVRSPDGVSGAAPLDERQFGGRRIKPLGWGLDDRAVVLGETRYRLVKVDIPEHKWALVGLFPDGVYPELPTGQMWLTHAGYLFGLTLITVVVVLWGSVRRRRQAERVLTKHRETLEDVVNRRTRQLEKVNDTLVRELEEKRFAEKRLRENEASFKRANRIAGLGSWEWDLVEDKVFLSEVMMAIYDSDSESLEGRFMDVINRMVHPDDRDRVLQAGRELVETGKGEPLEYRIIRGDGEVRWMRAEVPEVKEFSRTGEAVSLIGTVQDITERKLNENALVRHKAAMEQSVDGIAITNLDGMVEFVNPAWAEMHGFRVDELVGVSLDSFHPPSQVEDHLREFLRKVVAYGSCEGEIGHVTRNGRAFPTWTSASLMADHEGSPVGFVCICRDISTQKQAETLLKRAKDEAEAATRAKSAFLANMSHEIRTPMNGVIGMIDILLDTGLNHEQRDYAESVKSSADALLILINDILDFSKIEAGKLDIEKIEFNLRTVLEDLSDVMAIRAREKGLDFASLINDNVPVHLKGDPVRLRQILTNLAGNAVKFVEKGSVMIRVAVKEDVAHRVRLFFDVVDTGIGIHKDFQDRIFESFSQGDSSTTRKYGGSGLGLTISKQLTHMMKGNIGMESRHGQGATFWFTAEFEKQVGVVEEWGDGTDALQGARLLIVDDNSVNRQVFREYARAWGCCVEEVASGPDAIEVAERAVSEGAPFDAAVIDMQMPGMDGEEVGRLFKARETLRNIPLLMATSIGQRGDAVRMKEVGFSAYLTKPVRKKELCERLIQMLKRGEAGAQEPDKDQAVPVGWREDRLEQRENLSIHVLLAEDNRMNQRVAVNMLQKMGHTVKVANDGVEAVKAFVSETFDLILMDGQMPQMDGLEASEEIRRIEREEAEGLGERPRPVPIIAVTANAMKGDRERFLAAGMDEYIAKPIKIKELEEMIRRVVGTDSS